MGFSRFEPLISMDFYGLMCLNENRIMLANQNDMRTNHNGMLTNHRWEYGGIVMQLWPHISWQYHGINQPSMEFSMGLKVFFFFRGFFLTTSHSWGVIRLCSHCLEGLQAQVLMENLMDHAGHAGPA